MDEVRQLSFVLNTSTENLKKSGHKLANLNHELKATRDLHETVSEKNQNLEQKLLELKSLL